MDVEQPALGNVGVDSVAMLLSWSWDDGWTVQFSSRLSGSSTFAQRSYKRQEATEALQVIQDEVACLLGLV